MSSSEKEGGPRTPHSVAIYAHPLSCGIDWGAGLCVCVQVCVCMCVCVHLYVCVCVHARARSHGNTFYRTCSLENTFYGPC
jgi:hypothetical protein